MRSVPIWSSSLVADATSDANQFHLPELFQLAAVLEADAHENAAGAVAEDGGAGMDAGASEQFTEMRKVRKLVATRT